MLLAVEAFNTMLHVWSSFLHILPDSNQKSTKNTAFNTMFSYIGFPQNNMASALNFWT